MSSRAREFLDRWELEHLGAVPEDREFAGVDPTRRKLSKGCSRRGHIGGRAQNSRSARFDT